MEFTDILYEKYNDRARITINRPEKRNMFTNHTLCELVAAFRCAWEDKEVRAVILTGAGNKYFTIGGDMSPSEAEPLPLESLPMPDLLAQLLKAIREIPKPVICAVNGFAVGGGYILDLVCDLTIASSTAVFRMVGMDPGFGTAYLAHAVGEKRAREIIFSGAKYSAEQFAQWGLVNKVVAPEELLAEADKMVDGIKLDAKAVATMKASFNAATANIGGIQSMAGVAENMYYNLI
ncbi:MAG: enoyl-CoA hydratase-related protein [Oscillospiraceae bacterium]